MRPQYSILSARDVCAHVVQLLTTALAWTSPAPSVSASLMVRLLVRAAVEMRSLFAVVQDALAVPGVETVRKALHALLPPTPEKLLPGLIDALQRDIPKSLSRRPRLMAVDLHLRPFYGDRKTQGTYRGQPKASTKTFFAYATLMVIGRRRSYTVGLVPVVNGQEQTEILAQLLAQAGRIGLHPRRLLLDRGFYAATTIAWLQGEGIPFVMPMIRRGQAESTGTARFFGRARSGWASYTWTARPRRGGRKQAAVTVTIDVCMAPRPGEGPWVFACWGVGALTPAMVARQYRRRFGIETSYRQLGQGLAMTCSKSATYRLLLVGIALVLRNVWLWLHATILSVGAGGVHRVRQARLRLRRVMRWLAVSFDEELGVRLEVVVPN